MADAPKHIWITPGDPEWYTEPHPDHPEAALEVKYVRCDSTRVQTIERETQQEPAGESVRCSCEWSHPVDGFVRSEWPAELDSACPVHSGAEAPQEPEDYFYHVEPGRGGVAVSFEYHVACRQAAGVVMGQSLLEWIRYRATGTPEQTEAGENPLSQLRSDAVNALRAALEHPTGEGWPLQTVCALEDMVQHIVADGFARALLESLQNEEGGSDGE